LEENQMLMRARTLVAAALVLAVAGVAIAGQIVGPKSQGKWVQGSYAQVNLWCVAAFQCTHPPLLHGSDTVVVTTPNEPVKGICNAAGGDIEGCNACSASPPIKPCEYWLEKK
jgi:hypothetical protein